MKNFIQNVPKAELHIHIEGSFEPELMFKIAKRNKIKLKYRQAYHFQDLQSFLNIYYQNMQVLLQEQDYYDLMWAYLNKAKQQNIRHAEIFFDPQAHTDRGVAFETVVDGLHHAIEDGRKKLGISAKLIMCFLRNLTEDSAIKIFKQALKYKEWIVAVGLDSEEKGNPPSKFKKVYDMARSEGFFATAHAGEEGLAKYIWEALDILKVQRIDHGIHCMDDPKLVARLVKEKIPLTVCPLSNVKLHVVKDMQQHPLKKMLQANLCATINSDDPAFFGGYVEENIEAAQAALGLTQPDIYQLEKNAFQGAFISNKEKQMLVKELDDYCHASQGVQCTPRGGIQKN